VPEKCGLDSEKVCRRNYLEDIFDMIKEFWTADSPLQSTIILLVEAIAVALQSEFKVRTE
jgi:FKBP12-rapamycin complex-associated protein